MNSVMYGIFEDVPAGEYYIAEMGRNSPAQAGHYTCVEKFDSFAAANAYVEKRIAETTAYAVYFDAPSLQGCIEEVNCYAGAWGGRNGYYDNFPTFAEAEECLTELLDNV